MTDKENYKLRLSDFIPFNYGLLAYLNRNNNRSKQEESILKRSVGLFVYNYFFNLGITALAIYGAVQGLEKLFN